MEDNVVDIGRWVSLGIYLFIILVAFIFELVNPVSLGTTTMVAFVPAAVIAGVTDFVWWLLLVEVGSAVVLWFFIYWFIIKVLMANMKKKKYKVDFVDQLKATETLLTKGTSNLYGENHYGEIQIDDKTYLALPAEEHKKIYSNSLVKIEYIKGNVCYVKEV